MLLLCLGTARAATIVASNSVADALAAANTGDTVLLAGPTVFHERVIVSKSVRLLGANSPVIDAGGTGTPLTVAAPDVEVRGITICNSGSDLTAFDAGIMITAPGATIRDCIVENDAFGVCVRGVSGSRIERNEIFGAKELPSAKRGNGIHLWRTKNNRIVGNRIHDKRDGMYFSYADNNVIAENSVGDTRFGIHYMYSHQNRLLSNSLTANAVGATLMFSRQSLLQGNQVTANRRHGILFKQVDQSRIVGNTISGHNRGLFIQQATQNRFEENIIAKNDIGVYMSNCSEQNVFVKNSFIGNTDQIWQPEDEVERGRLASNAFSEKRAGNFWSDYTGTDRNRDGIGDTPYHETDVFGYIVDKHPQARVLAMSPAVALLRKGEELMPLLDTPGVTDSFPMMTPARLENHSLLTSAPTKVKNR